MDEVTLGGSVGTAEESTTASMAALRESRGEQVSANPELVEVFALQDRLQELITANPIAAAKARRLAVAAEVSSSLRAQIAAVEAQL